MAILLYLQFQSSVIWKYSMESPRSKQLTSFKLCTMLSGVMTPHAILLCSTWDTDDPRVQRIHAADTACGVVT